MTFEEESIVAFAAELSLALSYMLSCMTSQKYADEVYPIETVSFCDS